VVAETAPPSEASAALPEPTPELTPTVEPNPAPVTAIMETLELSGEQFAADGDPNAPITVIEFSDYG
jgi:hypothetical protein